MVSRKNLILVGIFGLAVFLRLYRLEENFIFSAEVGHNFLAIKNAIAIGQIPLFGPPTSHPWLFFGPLFYWLFGPILRISGFNPLAGGYFGAILGILTVVLNYLVIKKIFSEKVALISTFLISVSPLWLEVTREARFFSLVLPLLYFFLWALVEKKFFFLGLSLGLMLNFHYTPLILVPFSVSVLWIKKMKFKRNDLLSSFFGFLIPTLPLLIYDLGHNLQMLKNLVAWVPYRIAGFIGLYPKNTISANLIQENLFSFYQFFNKSFLTNNSLLSLALLIIMFFYLLKKIRQSLILLWLGWGLTALFVHGAPPLHYFLPLFPLPIIIFSLLLSDLWKKRLGKIIVCTTLLIISAINFNFFFSDKWFFLPQDKIWPGTFYVPYQLQKEVVKTIIEDAGNRKYNLFRVGAYDYFEDNFSQNYQYLAWWFGNEPTIKEAKLSYIIYEDQIRLLQKATKIFAKDGVVVFKEEK